MSTRKLEHALRWLDAKHVFAASIVELANATNTTGATAALRALANTFGKFGYEVRASALKLEPRLVAREREFAGVIVRAARRWPKLGREKRGKVFAAINGRLPKGRKAVVDYAVSPDGRLVTVAHHQFPSIENLVALAAVNLIDMQSKADRSALTKKPPAPAIIKCVVCKKDFVQKPDVKRSVACNKACRHKRHKELMRIWKRKDDAIARANRSMGM